MQFYIDKFDQLGAQVVALCPQLHCHNEQIETELNLSFPVLRDTNNKVASAFGLRNEQPTDVIAAEISLGLDLPQHNGSDNWDLPIPARYVIDLNSRVVYASHHLDHRCRTEPLDCLERIAADS